MFLVLVCHLTGILNSISIKFPVSLYDGVLYGHRHGGEPKKSFQSGVNTGGKLLLVYWAACRVISCART